VVGARGIATHAESAQELASRGVKSESSPEHVYASDSPPDHVIRPSSEIHCPATIGDARIDRVALLKSEEASARLHGGKQIGSAQCKSLQTERVRRICLLSRDDATTRPLVSPVASAENDVHDLAIAVQDRGPHIKAQAAVLLLDNVTQPIAQLVVAREQVRHSGGLQIRSRGFITAAAQAEDACSDGQGVEGTHRRAPFGFDWTTTGRGTHGGREAGCAPGSGGRSDRVEETTCCRCCSGGMVQGTARTAVHNRRRDTGILQRVDS
jgi:hypothetical protein